MALKFFIERGKAMKKIGVFVVVIASMVFLTGAVMAADITDPLAKEADRKKVF